MSLTTGEKFCATLKAAVDRLTAEEAGEDPDVAEVAFMRRLARISLEAGGYEDEIKRARKRWEKVKTPKARARRKAEWVAALQRQADLEVRAA